MSSKVRTFMNKILILIKKMDYNHKNFKAIIVLIVFSHHSPVMKGFMFNVHVTESMKMNYSSN